MRAFLYFSDFIVPFIMFYIVIYGFFNKSDVYENFLDGVKEGFKIVVNIAPTMVALLVSIGIFRASGALDFVSGLLEPVGKLLHIPAAVLPVFLVRIFSSSAASGSPGAIMASWAASFPSIRHPNGSTSSPMC